MKALLPLILLPLAGCTASPGNPGATVLTLNGDLMAPGYQQDIHGGPPSGGYAPYYREYRISSTPASNGTK